jgi:gluconolactonase
MNKNIASMLGQGDQLQEFARRDFLHLSATTATLLGFGGLLSACDGDDDDQTGTPAPAPTPPPTAAQPLPRQPAITDQDVLNFALGLAHLTANFHSFAATGAGVSPPVLGGAKVAFTDPALQSYAQELLYREVQHFNLLRLQLGTAAQPLPTVDLTSTGGFQKAAGAILGQGTGGVFDPFGGENNYLLAAYLFQDVIVTAYKSAIRLLPTKNYVNSFAGMLATKAYHAGLLRTLLYRRGLTNPALHAATEEIAKVRDRLDGLSVTDRGVALNEDRTSIAPVDSDGAVFGRTLGQVLNVMYVNDGAVRSGGFFPDGLRVPYVDNTSGYGFVEKYDARLDFLIDPNEVVREIAGDFNWIEGPLWIGGADGYLLTSHPRNNYITRWSERDGFSVFLTPSGAPEPIDPLKYAEPGSNGLFLGRGGVLVADGSLRSVRLLDLETKTFTLIADSYEGTKFNSPNDFAVSPRDGSIYFTDPIWGLRGHMNAPLRETDYTGIFRIDRNNNVSLFGKFVLPNGIGISPGGTKLYHTDIARGWVEHTLDENGMSASNRDFIPRQALSGGDGLKIDAAGNMWATVSDGITIVTPEGTRLGTIRMNDTAANCEIGADGYLYITSNRRLARIKVRAKKLMIPQFTSRLMARKT